MSIYILWRGGEGLEVVDETDDEEEVSGLVHEHSMAYKSECWSRDWSTANGEERRAIEEWEE